MRTCARSESFVADYQTFVHFVYSLTEKDFEISNDKEIVTFIAHLGEKPHFVVIRRGELQTFDYASEFVGMANHYFSVDGFSSDSMSVDGQIYNFPHETMRVILESLLCKIEEKSQG